jgi:hypothetical protein
MSIEERRALLGEVESPRRGAPVVAIAFALVAAGGIAASAWLWTRLEGERDARIASEARLAAETLARANEVAESARRLGAVEGELAIARTAARDADEARVRNEKAADALIASFLRSSQIELGGSTTTLAREVLRGGALEDLSKSLPEAKYLAVALAVVEALARERSASSPGELYRDLTFAADFAGRARASLDPASATLGDALHAVAQLMWGSRRLPFVEPKVADALRADAIKFALEAREARKAAGGRRLALTLVLLAEIERSDRRLAEAALLLSDADIEVLKDGSPLEAAAVELELAEVQFELGRTQQAVDLLEARARSLAAESSGADASSAAAAVVRLRETRMRMLEVMGLPKSDEARWMVERLSLARANLAAKRYAPVVESLPAVLRFLEKDQSRFRERLDCALVLARAMDALGSGRAAYETLDQKQLADDVRILGPEHQLSKDFESLRAELRARK